MSGIAYCLIDRDGRVIGCNARVEIDSPASAFSALRQLDRGLCAADWRRWRQLLDALLRPITITLVPNSHV